MANYYLTRLGDELRAARRAQRVSGRALADLVGVHYSTISRFEAGLLCPAPEVLERLAQALDLNADELDALAHPRLPSLGPYLRAKFDLPPEAVTELEEHFRDVQAELQQAEVRR